MTRRDATDRSTVARWFLTLLGLTLGIVLALVEAHPAYADEGIATWYGPGFHGNRMANGQVFNQDDPTTTAANHYPFGTWLRVTRVPAGPSIVVQVRDRGAFGHALDLSRGAFAQLAPLEVGVIRIRVEVVDGPAQPESTPPVAAPTRERSSRGGQRPAPADSVTLLTQARSGVATAAAQPRAGPAALLTETQLAAYHQRRADHALARLLALPVTDPTPAVVHYTVQRGDTLWDLAQATGTTVKTLATLNSLANPSLILVGQVLILPTPT